LAELVFRVFSELGFVTIFRWLLSKNPPFWDASIISSAVSNQWLILTIAKHIVISSFFILVVKLITHNKSVKKLFCIEPTQLRSDSIIMGAIIFAIFLIVLETIGCTYISQSNEITFLDNLFNFSNKQLYTRSIMLVASIIAGIILSIFYNRILIQRNRTNEILKLTARIKIDESKIINKKSFLSDLLNTALIVVEEADYGIVVIYEDDIAVFVDVVGHDKQLKGFRTKGFLSSSKSPDIIKIQKGKQLLLSKTEGNEKSIINAYVKPSSESLIVILSHNQEKIAGLVLEKTKGNFSNESVEIAKTLKNIPAAFFSNVYAFQEEQRVFEDMLLSIIKILSIHNEYTKKHSINVSNLATGIAKELGLNENQIKLVYWSGLVHDIGKILIPDSILDKKNALTKEEWELVKKHPTWGYEALNDNISHSKIAKYVLYHHERWDGKGYPEGISGKAIPLISRIITVADTYDAMTHKRPYRDAVSKDSALKEILENSGTQFDPNVVKAFIDNSDKIIENSKRNDLTNI
jgi:putative nucleotidyltransferase with HDIG domain